MIACPSRREMQLSERHVIRARTYTTFREDQSRAARTSRNQLRRAFRERISERPNVTQSVQACLSREEEQRRTSRNQVRRAFRRG
ncbi:MAG: hypothetical protein U5K84_14160 [Alkalibacterium sp.]|nr:hypothetical protein [Alkalibacterium sp.]